MAQESNVDVEAKFIKDISSSNGSIDAQELPSELASSVGSSLGLNPSAPEFVPRMTSAEFATKLFNDLAATPYAPWSNATTEEVSFGPPYIGIWRETAQLNPSAQPYVPASATLMQQQQQDEEQEQLETTITNEMEGGCGDNVEDSPRCSGGGGLQTYVGDETDGGCCLCTLM